jgi:hypothetical protein
MTVKPCEKCTVKDYDGHYRCMICYREFTVATEEDVMNMTQVAPALARIQELETENTSLTLKLAAMIATMKAMKNPPKPEAIDTQMRGVWQENDNDA